MKLKVCKICGKNYRPKSNRQRYCAKCGRRGGIRECEVCHRRFKPTANTTGKYCSINCYKKSRKLKRIRQCAICSEMFDPGPGRARCGQKTCSLICADKLRTKERPKCLTCGNPVKQLKNKYCSRSCAMSNQNRKGQRRRLPDGTLRNHASGYKTIKANGKWMMHHRYVMEQILGRPLESHERVHHKNGDRSDNRPENLELWKVKKKDPAGVRQEDYHCAGCRCYDRLPSTFVNGVLSI